MSAFEWPKNFPDTKSMMTLLMETIDKSWKNEISAENIDKWLNNFNGKVLTVEVEQRIALWMLCNFTYYNSKDINYLCRIVYKNLLHDIAKDSDDINENWLSEVLKQVYFAAMGSAADSGGMLLYHFRQEAGLSMDSFFYPSAIPKNENGIVVLIDDVTLSGSTATRFFHRNIESMVYKKAYYLTLFASEKAIERIEELGVTVIYSTLLTDRDRCFTENSIMFSDFPELRDKASELAAYYGKLIEPDNPLGFKNGQFCFGMEYNTPNNTLPIFWSNNNWNPIFERKEKIYDAKQRNDILERFI